MFPERGRNDQAAVGASSPNLPLNCGQVEVAPARVKQHAYRAASRAGDVATGETEPQEPHRLVPEPLARESETTPVDVRVPLPIPRRLAAKTSRAKPHVRSQKHSVNLLRWSLQPDTDPDSPAGGQIGQVSTGYAYVRRVRQSERGGCDYPRDPDHHVESTVTGERESVVERFGQTFSQVTFVNAGPGDGVRRLNWIRKEFRPAFRVESRATGL